MDFLLSGIRGAYVFSSLIALNQIAIGIGIAYLAFRPQRYALQVLEIIDTYTNKWNETYKTEHRDVAISQLHVMKALDFHAKGKPSVFFGLESLQKQRSRPLWMGGAGLPINSLGAKDCVEATLKNKSYSLLEIFSRDVRNVTIATTATIMLTVLASVFPDFKVSGYVIFFGLLCSFVCAALPAWCIFKGRSYVERCSDAAKTLDLWLQECTRNVKSE